MLTVHRINPTGYYANTYLLTTDGKTAVAIDAAEPRVLEEARKLGLTVSCVLLTHGHYDHTSGCAALKAAGAKIGCLTWEEPVVLGRASLSTPVHPVPPFTLDFTYDDGDIIEEAGMQIRVIATPGHTSGGACYFIENYLFTGDTLFFESVGRTDFPTGDYATLEKSVKKLYALDGDYTVYPGHGESTTLGYERKNNRCIRVC